MTKHTTDGQEYRAMRNERVIGKPWVVSLGYYQPLPLSGKYKWKTTLVVSEHDSAQEALSAVAEILRAS